MVLSQQMRLLNFETNFINDSIDDPGSLSDVNYGTLTVPTGGAIFAFRVVASATAADTAVVALDMNSERFYAGTSPTGAFVTGDNEIAAMIYLPAGTYTDVTFKLRSTAYARLSAISAGLILFKDLTKVDWASCALNTNISLIAPTTRKTPIGSTAKATYFVYVWGACSESVTRINNITDDTHYPTGLGIYFDDVRVDWTKRFLPGVQGYGASGIYAVTVDVGSTHTVKFNSAYTYPNLYFSIICCPWILTDTASFPVQTLSVTQESTIYVTAEPLFSDPATKTVRVGKLRCISFGDATDFYESLTGVGILEFEHKFTAVKPSTTGIVQAFGLGGCISHVGVDLA